MATTAYFTARASYKTVVSNYDFSQLYLSTTSMSDMLIGALTQTTSRSDVTGSDGKKLNDYSGLKQAVLDLKSPSNVGKSITGYSHNMYASKDGTENDLLMAAAADPVEAGVIDGVKVTIKLEKTWPQTGADGNPTGKDYYSFSITTTGFYRNNVVSVQDTVYNLAGTTSKPSKSPSFDTFFKNTGGNKADTKGERAVIIATQEISDNAYFENTYTIFTEASGGDNRFYGGVVSTGALFFKGQANFSIPKPGQVATQSGGYVDQANARHDWFINGDLGLLADNTQNLNLNGNNLYVNGDLIIGNAQGVSAHNIYVTGNIYYTCSGAKITIQDENGNADASAGGVYCGGNVYYAGDYANADGKTYMPLKNDDGTMNSGFSNKYGSAWAAEYIKNHPDDEANAYTLQAEYEYINRKASDACGEIGVSDAGKSWKVSTDKIDNLTNDDENVTFCVGNGSTGGSFPTSRFTNLTDKGDYDPANVTVDYSTIVASGNQYVYQGQTGTIKELFDADTGVTKANDWTAYTAKEKTMKNVLELDVSSPTIGFKYDSDDGWGFDSEWKIKEIDQTYTTANGTYVEAHKERGGGASYTFYSATDTEKKYPSKLTFDSNNGVTIDIGFNPDGYLLMLPSAADLMSSGGGKGDYYLTYNIHTSEKIEASDDGYKGTMPIVLAANFDDGSKTTKHKNAAGKEDYNAFSWTGAKPIYDWSSGWPPTITGYEKTAQGNGASLTVVNIVNEDGTASAGTVTGDTASAGGNVIFEMANINSEGKYVAYDESLSGLDAVTYHAGDHDLVGTLNQNEELRKAGKDKYNSNTDSNIKNLYKSSGNKSDVQPQFENRIMLISNKKTTSTGDGFAYVSDSDTELFCGYIYAPSGMYGNNYGNQKTPIFGGLIVSEMVTAMASFEYADPDPTIVAQMLQGLTPKGSSSKTTGSVDGIWYIDNVNYGKNYIG
ncbi:MAG: hypothetical protein IK093_12425 [Ruminiclostridium sp.]|nr:hypothetical protein [Ruminiclostridium sp.]